MKRFLAILLAFCVVLTLLPPATAVETEPAAAFEAETPVEQADAAGAAAEHATALADDDDAGDPDPDPDPEPDPEPEPIAVERISLSDTALTLMAERTHPLLLTVFPENATDKTAVWTTSNPSVAAVDANGVVTAVGLGTAVITAKVADRTASCTVTVRFGDVYESAYYYNDVYWALANNITNGTSNTMFSPDQACTRAQAVTLLYRINGSPAAGGANPFADISSGAYYYNAVLWASQNGIVVGTSATTFSPNQTCTRAQIVTMIWRCRRQRPAAANGFSDVASNSYYYTPVRWAAEQGVTNGTAPGRFSPDAPCTRAQIIRFLHNCDARQNAILNRSVWQVYYPQAEAVLDQVGWDLRAAFNWSASLPYYGHGKADMPENPSPGTEWFANFGFTNRKGNCYVMAATFYEMAVCLGYQPRQMSGKVPLRRGGWGPHSWVEIDINGATYVFDPDFTYGTGRNGYMISYGQTGTWQYADYTVMSL